MNQSKHYRDKAGESYFKYIQKNAHEGGRINSRKFNEFVALDDVVLDFGCGGGWILGNLQCKRKIGVEINTAAHASCIENGLDVYQSLEQVDVLADVVISHHCLEHVPHPIETLIALRSKLKPAGRLILVLPVDDWRVQMDYSGADIDHHLHTWTPRLIANTLSEAGYTANCVKIRSHAWFPYWYVIAPRVPVFLFNILCNIHSFVSKRREMIVVASMRVG